MRAFDLEVRALVFSKTGRFVPVVKATSVLEVSVVEPEVLVDLVDQV